MSDNLEFDFEGIEQLPLKEFSEKAYLDYSMYVILDRALPHIGDGLKPVQRRIVYAMSDLGLRAGTKYKKSARTVGDVLGKFHPHGDSACYEAMVLMAQPFSYRYPLVDGQGNWGSPDDPKSFAAMRYTESRLSVYADLLLNEISLGTVEWTPNFDGTLEEPSILPARLPNVLLNGTSGIAVGMATDIPPHNLREIADACIHLLKEPNATIRDLCKFVKGPDYPTDAEIITPRKDIINMYKTGNGSIRMRAKYNMEDNDIIITALPHQVSGNKVLQQIDAQRIAKKLPMVEDLRDESDHENPTRLVIITRSNRIDVPQLMGHLFATTDLERTYRVNLNMIGTDGRPQVKDLLMIIKEWLEFRTETVRKRLQFRLDKVDLRLHILKGYVIAYLNIDEVIEIIRREAKPKPVLMERFKLSDTQAEAILELKLRHLAKLEEMKIKKEQRELKKEKDELEKILGSKQRMNTLIKREITEDAKKYGDDRRSPIVSRDAAQVIDETSLVSSEPVTVVLSQKGWVRSAKGHDIDPTSLNYKSGDGFLVSASGKSNELAVFFDSSGRVYSLMAHILPSARGYGEPLTTRVNSPDGARFAGIMMGSPEQQYIFASDAGFGFVCNFGELFVRNKNGKRILNVPKGADVVAPALISDYDTDWFAIITNEGRMLVFPTRELPQMSKGKGIRIVAISADRVSKRQEYVTHLISIPEGDGIVLHSGKRQKRLSDDDLNEYIVEHLGLRGKKLPRGFLKVDRLEIFSDQE